MRRLLPGAERWAAKFEPERPVSRRQLRPTIIVGALLLVGAVVQGARGQMRSYPFSCYPTFQWIAAREMPDLMIIVVEDDGRPRDVAHGRDAAGRRTQRQWAEVWSLAGVTAPVDARRLRAYWAALAPPTRAGGRVVTFFRVYRSVIPGEGGRIERPAVRLLAISE